MASQQRDISPSLMDDDFHMRRHGIQICSVNEESHAHTNVVDEEDDDVVFLCEEKKGNKDDNKRYKRLTSYSSSSSGSENNSVDSAVRMDMNKNVSNSRSTTINKNSLNLNENTWSRESLVGAMSSPPPTANENTKQIENDEEIVFLDQVMSNIGAAKKPESRGDKRMCSVASLPVVDFETEPEEGAGTSNSRKRPASSIDLPSQSYFLDKNKSSKADLCEFPSWLQEEGTNYERRPKTRWNAPSQNQNPPLHFQGSQMNPAETQSYLQSELQQVTSDSYRFNNNYNAAWTPITLTGAQTAGILALDHQVQTVPQAPHHKKSQVGSTLSQPSQEGGIHINRRDDLLGQVNDHEGRSKNRERHSSRNSQRDRSSSKDGVRSRSRSLERERKHCGSRERRKSRSTSRERRERRPYGNHHSQDRGRWHQKEEISYRSRNTNSRGRRPWNGRFAHQTSNNFHHKENYNKYDSQERSYNNRRGIRKWDKYNSRFRSDQRDNTYNFVKEQEIRETNPSPNQISPNFIPTSNRSSWDKGQCSRATAPNETTKTWHIPGPETCRSSLRKDNVSGTAQDPLSNSEQQPENDKAGYYPPVSHAKQRIAHKNAVGSANQNGAGMAPSPSAGFNVEQPRLKPGVPLYSPPPMRNAAQTNSGTSSDCIRNPSSSHSRKSVSEILKLIKTCPMCYGRIFEDRKAAVFHLLKEHKRKFCFVCFKTISNLGVECKQHFLEHTGNDPEELAPCPLCHEKQTYEGLHIHLGKMHFKPFENLKRRPTGEISSKQSREGHKPKAFPQKPKNSGNGYRSHGQNQHRQQFDPQRSSTQINFKPHKSKVDRKKQEVVHSELSENSGASSPETDRNGNDVEHNLIHAPREDIRSFRIPKKKSG